MQRNKLILLLGDVIIPILGYYLWNWGLYFIFLFLFLDLLSYNILYYFKNRKIQQFKNQSIETKQMIGHFGILFLTTALIFIGYSYLFNALQATNYTTEMISFFMYKDMGFTQGYILLPIIILTALMTYKTEFILHGQFAKQSIPQLFMSYLRDNLATLCLLGFFLLLFALHILSPAVYFYVGIFLFGIYKVLLLKRA